MDFHYQASAVSRITPIDKVSGMREIPGGWTKGQVFLANLLLNIFEFILIKDIGLSFPCTNFVKI